MKKIGLILVLMCVVSADINPNPNAIQKTEITEKHVLNESNVLKGIEQSQKQYDATQKHHPVIKQQPIQKIQEHKQESNAQVNVKYSPNDVSKQHHKSHHVSHHSTQAQQDDQNHHANRKRHYAHKFVKSHIVHKLTNTDVDVEGFENKIVEMLREIELGKINITTMAVLNNYVDVIFNHLRRIIIIQNLNAVPLSKETVKVKHSGHCHLSHGNLTNIATIYRTHDAFISYNPTEKKVTLGFPFKLSDLKIHYDYHLKSRLFKTHGGVNGSIKNVQFNAVFSYYYKSDKLTLDHFDLTNNGTLTMSFSGHKVVEWLIKNSVTKAFKHTFHPKIVKTLQMHGQAYMQKNIGKLNEIIAKKLHE